MVRQLFVVGRIDLPGADFAEAARSCAAFSSVSLVESVAGIREKIGQSEDDAVILVCDESAGPLISLAERLPVVVCVTGAESDESVPGHPFIHWIPYPDDADASVRSLTALVDQVWSARKKQDALQDEAERAHRFFAVLANASMEGVIVFREGRVVHVNDIGCRILGFERDDLIGSRPTDRVPEEWRSQVRSRMAGHDSVYSFLFRRPDGSTVPIRVHGQNVDMEGIPYRITSFIDLSRESPVPFADDWSERELYGAEAPVVWVGGSGEILYMNSVMRDMLLIEHLDLDGMHIWEIDEELDEEGWTDLMADFREHGVVDFRTHVRRMDGSTFHILVHARYRRLDGFEYISASFEDVSSQMAMRRSVAQSRHRLGLAMEAATLGLWEWSVDQNVVTLSPELEEMLSGIGALPRSGLRAVLTGVDRRDAASVVETIARAVETRSRFSFRCRLRKAGGGSAPRWLECWGDVHVDEEIDETIVLGAALDITDRKRRLREYQLERERFRAFADGSLDGFFLLEVRLTDDGSIDFVPTYVNDVVGKIIGVDRSRLIGRSMRENCPVSLRVGIGEMIVRAYTSGEAREGEFEIERASGAVIWLRVQAVPYSQGVGVVVRDVTERRRKEAELAAYRQRLEDMVKARTAKLKRSEAEFRSVVESARDIMGIVDENHNYQFVNNAARTSRVEVIVGKRAGQYVRESHRAEFDAAIDNVFQSSEEGRLEVPVDWEDGSVRWMDCRFSPVKAGDDRVESVTIVCRDVTEQRMVHERVEQMNRDLERRVDERISEIRTLLDTSRRLAALQDESSILGTVTDTLLSVVPGACGVAVWARESAGDQLELLAFDGAELYGSPSDGIDPQSELVRRIRQEEASGGAVLLTADERGGAELDSLTRVADCRMALATMIADARGLELFVVVATEESGTDVDERARRFLESITAQTAVAINNSRLFREIRAVSLRLLHVQESERREVAHELHDQVGGLLTSLQFVLQLSTLAENGAEESVKEALDMVKALMDEVRSLTLTLRPALLDDFGLVPALEGLIKRHRKQGALEVALEYDFDRGIRFDTDVETAAYRVIQEALTNVIRHAQTDSASVNVSLLDDRLQVEIRDRGRGFSVEQAVTRGRSLGVRGMFERVELLEGRTSIEAVSGEGTRIRFHIPLQSNGGIPS